MLPLTSPLEKRPFTKTALTENVQTGLILKPSKRTPFYLLGGRVKIILKIFKMSFKDRIFKIVIIIIA